MAKLVSKIVEIWHDRKRILGMPISFTRYALSEDRLFLKRGFLNVRHDEIVLYRVRDLRVSVSLWQRIFGVGTEHNINFASVKGILSAINRFESGMA